MSYKIIDNFLDKDLFLKISDDLKGENTPWFLRKQDEDSKQPKKHQQRFKKYLLDKQLTKGKQ